MAGEGEPKQASQPSLPKVVAGLSSTPVVASLWEEEANQNSSQQKLLLLLCWEEALVSPESLFREKAAEEGVARASMTRDRQTQQRHCRTEERYPIGEFVQWFREQLVPLVWIRMVDLRRNNHRVERMAGETTWWR